MSLPRYRVFGRLVESQAPLAGLPAAAPGDGPADITIRLGAPPGFRPDACRPVYEWRPPGGELICGLLAHGRALVFEYPDCAHFDLPGGGQVFAEVTGECAPNVLRHLLVQQVIPRWLGEQGALILHAGAVALAGQGAVAFVGESGRGKSTMAARLAAARAGAEVLADDSLLVETKAGGQVLSQGPGTAAVPLGALYCLDDPAAGAGRVQLEPLAGQRALMALLDSVFTLNPRRPENSAAGFRAVAGLLNAGVPVYVLSYPRDFERLPEVFDVLEAALAGHAREAMPAG